MKSSEIRQQFLDYFKSKGHAIVASSPLVPGNDPTLLFTNAGMVQFKDYFTGAEKPSFVRAATSQKCVRAGGKHNDLDNVGYTARHHTFFEMLGNFSFGDYFKEEAIRWSFELLTDKKEGFGLDPKRLYVTVFEGDKNAPRDTEAFEIWKKFIPENHIYFLPAKSNWWEAGDNGAVLLRLGWGVGKLGAGLVGV